MLAELNLFLGARDGNAQRLGLSVFARWNAEVLDQQEYTLAPAAFQALSVPSGAQGVLIDPGGAVSLTLKGVTGDTGIAVAPATLPITVPIILPLGPTAVLGIRNGAGVAQTIRVAFL
jgi:hypothetical protein